MNILVILGHQSQGSFCQAIARSVVEEAGSAGHEVVFHDLYAEGFDPILTQDELAADSPRCPVVRRHIDELLAADGIVIVHPNWWSQPPAIVKGWLDRVLRQGAIYRFGPQGQVQGQLTGKTALVFTTSNTPREAELALYGDPLENLWGTCVFKFCGVERFMRRNFESMIMSTPDERRDWLAEVRRLARQFFPPSDERS